MWMPLAAAGVGWLAGMAGMAGTAVDMLLDRGSGRFWLSVSFDLL